MPRKGAAARREIDPDPIYQNQLVTQLINKVLLSGKRGLSERIVYKALEDISEKTANDPTITLKRAVENARPLLEVRSRRVGGATYQVPVEVRPPRGTTLALLDHPVHLRRALVDLADLVRLAGVVQDALGRGRLARVDVGHDPDVPGPHERVLADDQGLPRPGWSASRRLFRSLRHVQLPRRGGHQRPTTGNGRTPGSPPPSCACLPCA